MARQVFFDPFGRATEGYNLGMQQEQQLQHNVRDARAQDYDFNVMNPYRLASTQRADILGASALPYQLQMQPLGLDEAKTALATHQLPLAEQWYRATGMAAPYAGVFGNAFGLNPASRDAQGNINYTMRGPDGTQQNVGSFNPQGTLDFLNLPQQLEFSKQAAMNDYYRSMANYGRAGPGAYYYDMQRGNSYLPGGIHAPQAQGSSPVDRFFAPTPAGGGQGGQAPGGVNMGGGMGSYNLPQPQGSGGVNYGGTPSPQQLQNADGGY